MSSLTPSSSFSSACREWRACYSARRNNLGRSYDPVPTMPNIFFGYLGYKAAGKLARQTRPAGSFEMASEDDTETHRTSAAWEKETGRADVPPAISSRRQKQPECNAAGLGQSRFGRLPPVITPFGTLRPLPGTGGIHLLAHDADRPPWPVSVDERVKYRASASTLLVSSGG